MKEQYEGEKKDRKKCRWNPFSAHSQPGDRGATGPQLGAGQSLLGEVSSLSARGQVSLHLSVLGEVEGSDLLSLLQLLLVTLDLGLELVYQGLHALVVLLVLLLAVAQLLDPM